MTAIAAPNLWLPPSMRQRRKDRWLDRALDFKRWKWRLLDTFAPIGVAADGDTMLDPTGDLVLNAAGDMELQDSTGCAACCPGCATCWTNDTVPSVNITIADFNYPTDWVCYSQDCSADPLYGTACDPCSVGRFNYGSGSIDGTPFNVPISSTLVCPGPLGGPGPGGHWRGYVPSPVTYLFYTAFGTTQLVPTQCLLFDVSCCCVSNCCQVTLQIFLVGCACEDNTGFTMFVLFDGGPQLFCPMPDSVTLDNQITSADQAFGAPLCDEHNTGGWGGTVTITKGT